MRLLVFLLLLSCGETNRCRVIESRLEGGYGLQTGWCRLYTVVPHGVARSVSLNRDALARVVAGIRADGVPIVNAFSDAESRRRAERLAEAYGGTVMSWLSVPQMVGETIYVPWEPGNEPDTLSALLTYAHEYQHVLQDRAEGPEFGMVYGLDLMSRAWFEADASNAERDVIFALYGETSAVKDDWASTLAAGYATGPASVSVFLGVLRAGDVVRDRGYFSTLGGSRVVGWANDV